MVFPDHDADMVGVFEAEFVSPACTVAVVFQYLQRNISPACVRAPASVAVDDTIANIALTGTETDADTATEEIYPGL